MGPGTGPRRVAVLADATTSWGPAVAAGLAGRHDVLSLTDVGGRWFLGGHPLGPTPITSTTGALALLATADVVLPVDATAGVRALTRVSGLPCATSGAATELAASWWTVRLLAADAGVAVADGIRVGRRQARGLDYLGPVTVRPDRGPTQARTEVTRPEDLCTALDHAFTYADQAVVEATPEGERVTVALLRRPDGAVAVSTGVQARPVLEDCGVGARTGEIPVGRRAVPAGGGRGGARPPHPSPGSAPIDAIGLDPVIRARVDASALELMDALAAHGLLTASFVVGDGPPVLDSVDLAPDLGPRAEAVRLLAGGATHAGLLDTLVAAARR